MTTPQGMAPIGSTELADGQPIGASTAVCGLPGVRSWQFDETGWLTVNRVWELPGAGSDSDDSLNFNTSRARNRRRVGDTYRNGRGERTCASHSRLG